MSVVGQHIRDSLALPRYVVGAYLEDLTDAQLLIRPAPGMNHIAWQLGHLIASEFFHVEQVCPGAMPKLPDGFGQQHAAEAAASDDPQDFLTKAEYLDEMDRQRAGTLAAIASLSDEQFAAPSPESIRYFGPTVGAVFSGESTHWMMHAGQWAVVRRQLGKPPLF